MAEASGSTEVKSPSVEEGGKVAIIGSGFIGRSWAVLFAKAGFAPCLYDIVEEQLTTAKELILVQLTSMEKEGLLGGQSAGEIAKRLTFQTELKNAVKDAFYVQESVFENEALKTKVFKELDACVDGTAILASSSSCIDPAKFTEHLTHRHNCIVAHPTNPPHLVPLVEVIPAPWTAPQVTTVTLELMRKLGQSPIVVKKVINGFVSNRLQYALIMEAWRLVEDGVASPEDIDTVITDGLGLRYSILGPFETIHLNANGVEDYCERYGENIVRICKEQGGPRQMSGQALDVLKQKMEQRIPLDQLEERRKLRDGRLAALARLRCGEEK